MNLQTYKDIMKNTIELEYPNYLKQKIINDIIKEKIAKYGKEENGIILIKGTEGQSERINKCIDQNYLTLKLIDLLEFRKGYKYSVSYKYKDIDFDELRNSLKEVAIDVNSEYYKDYSKGVSETEILYWESDDIFFVKFHKYLNVLDKKEVVMKSIRYPELIVFHKNMKLFEVRFDNLAFNNNYEFHLKSMEGRIATIRKYYKFNYEYFDMEKTIREIVENKKGFVKEIIWSFETAKSKGLTLRVGEDGVMPFLGDLELLIKDLRIKYDGKESIKECLDEVENYMKRTKEFANEKFRILSWVKYIENGNTKELDNSIDLKIIFNYSNNNYTLLNIYDNEINDMERINYVIRFIGKIAGDIEEL